MLWAELFQKEIGTTIFHQFTYVIMIADNIFDCIWYGACYFIPIYLVTFIVGITWEIIFAIVRGHEINEGAFVTTVLFASLLPT